MSSIKKLEYNYVYFNSNYLSKGKFDKNEYNSICLRDCENHPQIQVIATPLMHLPYFFRFLYFLHNNKRVNQIINLPFKKMWYPFIAKLKFDNDNPICFVVANASLPMDYLMFLKKRYPNCKMVKLHRDLMKITYMNPEYSEENMRRLFDLRMTYDDHEALEYGISHFQEIESKIEIPMDENYPLYDVFFAGKAKERLSKLVEAYDIFEKEGLNCFFYITNVRPEEQIVRKGIIYENKFMPYIDMLYYSVNSRCMFDVNQQGAVGFTSRFLEAVIYNKKLITDNPKVMKSKYYDTRYIQYVDRMSDIDASFVKDGEEPNYSYEGDFSPIYLIEQIERELKILEAKNV